LQRAGGERLDVGAVAESGRRLHVSRPNPTTLVVQLGHTLTVGESVTVAMPWTLRVPAYARDRISSFAGGLRLGSFFPILAWDPDRGWVTDPPARLLAESSTTPTADFDVRVRAPSGTRVVVSGDPLGHGRWHARAVRDVGLAVGRFRVAVTTAHAPGPVTIRVAYTVPPAFPPQAMRLRSAKISLERLSRLYGPYPWRTYTVVLMPDLPVLGIEYPTLTFVGYASPTFVLRHETGHQWFYSLVGNDQYTDPWLDEAGATWAERRLSGSLRTDLSPAAVRHVGESIAYWNSHREQYAAQVYTGGVVALRSLGPATLVDCALRLYVARNAYRIAKPGDLLDALDAVFPGAEARLRRFGIHR
jgi:hypothetical protein